MIIQRIKSSFRHLKWKLTLSYTAVTVGSLIIVALAFGYFLFSRAFIPLEIYENQFSDQWVRVVRENSEDIWRPVLSQNPIDHQLIAALMEESTLQITGYDLIQIGEFKIQMETVAQGSAFLVDPDGILLGTYNSKLTTDDDIGRPIDLGILPNLDESLEAALRGEDDLDKVFVTIDPNERFFFSVPIRDEANKTVLGVGIIYIESLPTSSDVPATMWILLGRSFLVLLMAVGVVGTIFGALNASGIAERLGQISSATEAWSHGNFEEFINDPFGDEISSLAHRLNHMAEQLQQFLKRSQEMAVSEERNRLARDLHDSAKQEALAASFHIGTALTLIESDLNSTKNHLIEADNLVNSVRKELTDLIHELRPISSNGKLFDETINEYIIEWAHQAGIEANLKVQGYIDLPLEIKQAIYRIMQEALANVARHSSAEKVEVSLEYQKNCVNFCVTDDGIGFEPQHSYSGIGLESMRERVETLNGILKIVSETGGGTKVCINVPVDV